MQTIKTAISIEKNLFEQVENIAQTMNVSRSKLFVMALRDYVDRLKNRELLAQINAAYAEELDASEQTLRLKTRRKHRLMVEGEW
jgi:metal-responsive CopG/Arc/MetJ family transcriptional regulator